jgi:hypothetical protein
VRQPINLPPLNNNPSIFFRQPTCPPSPASLPTCLPPLRSFLIYNQSTELLGGMDISVLVSCLTGLLKHTDIVTSPPVHSSIVQLLLAMLSPQVGSPVG